MRLSLPLIIALLTTLQAAPPAPSALPALPKLKALPALTANTDAPAPLATVILRPVTWLPVETNTGRINRIRSFTHFALNAPVPDLLRLLDTTDKAPAGPDSDEVRLLAHALVTRDLPTAQRYLGSGQRRHDRKFISGYFGALTQYHPDLIRTELHRLTDENDGRLDALYALMDTLIVRDPDNAIALFNQENRPAYPRLRDYFVYRLILHAPAKALDFILAETKNLPPDQQTKWLKKQLLSTGETNFDGLLNLARATGDRATHELVMSVIESSIRDEQGVIWRGSGLRSDISTERLRALRPFIAELPADQRQTFFTHLLAGFGGQPRINLDLLTAWHDTAPAEALVWSADPTNTPPNAFELLLATDAELALTRLQNTPAGPERANMLGELTKKFALDDLTATMAMTANLPAGLERDKSAEALAKVGADYDPDAFVALLADLPSDALAKQLTEHFASQWANHDPLSAATWLAKLPPSDTREAGLKAAASQIASHAPDQAIDIARSLAPSDGQHALLDELAGYTTPAHAEDILNLIAAMPASTQQNWLRRKAVTSLAKKDPALALELMANGTAGPLDTNLQQALVQGWADTSAADCAKWVQHALTASSETKPTNTTIRIAARGYANQNPDAALAWATTLPSAYQATNATLTIAYSLAESLPNRAWNTALSINPTAKQLLPIFREINRRHPEQISALLASSKLDDELLEKLNQALPR